jgi:hypothetical protein
MMLTGLDILLDRMKTAPEEFLKDGNVPYDGETFGGKWSDLLDYAWRVANEEERKALQEAKIEFYRDDFNERVMKRLAGEEVKQEEHPMQKFRIKTPAQNVAQNVMVSVGGSGGATSMLGQQGAQQNMATQNSMLSGNGSTNVQGVVQGGYGQAQVRQEGAAISTDSSFWNGVIASGKGKLW